MLTIDAESVVHIDIGERTVGDGERAMLLAYDGKKLALPAE